MPYNIPKYGKQLSCFAVWSGGFTPEEVDKIIDLEKLQEFEKGKVGHEIQRSLGSITISTATGCLNESPVSPRSLTTTTSCTTSMASMLSSTLSTGRTNTTRGTGIWSSVGRSGFVRSRWFFYSLIRKSMKVESLRSSRMATSMIRLHSNPRREIWSTSLHGCRIVLHLSLQVFDVVSSHG